MASRDPISYATTDPETGRPIMTKAEAEKLRRRKPVEKRGMLIVTTFRASDIPLLRKRAEWMAFLGMVPYFDLLLVSDFDVTHEERMEMSSLHKPFFSEVLTKSIKEPPRNAAWPDGVNTAFRKTYKILSGRYDLPPFSWTPYTGWFNFETDVTPLNPDAFKAMERLYHEGKKPFCGYLNETRLSDGKLVRHLNGAAIYPTNNSTPRYYNEKMMLTMGLPWDVAGMGEGLLGFSTMLSQDKYIHAFGTWDYRKEGNELTATQKLMTGAVFEKKYVLNGQIMHHGCKDGSLIDVLMGKKEVIVPEVKPVPVVTPPDGVSYTYVSKIPYKLTIKEKPSVAALTDEEKTVVKKDPYAGKRIKQKRIPGKRLRAPQKVKVKKPYFISPQMVELVKKDYNDMLPWKDIMKKYGMNPAILKEVLRERKN